MRDLFFRPMFNLADTFTCTLAGILMLNGHWLASVPVAIVGAAVSTLMRRRLPVWPARRIGR